MLGSIQTKETFAEDESNKNPISQPQSPEDFNHGSEIEIENVSNFLLKVFGNMEDA